MRNVLKRIAKKYLRLDTLDRRNSDSLDFHDLAVWQIRIALEAAYRAGKRSRKGSREPDFRKVIRDLITASDDLTSAIELASQRFNTGLLDDIDPAKGRLMDATSAAEKALKGGGK
jgi:hypothetical protein